MTTREEAQRLADALEPVSAYGRVGTRDVDQAVVQQAVQLLRQWPEAGEPVAWRHSKTLCLYDTEKDCQLADGDEWAEPLYAAPGAAPSQQPAPEPCCGEFATCDRACTPRGEWLGKRASQQPAPESGCVACVTCGQPAPERNEWREAVLDQLAAHAIDAPKDEPPASILRRIINMAVTIALDPAVSSDAQALIDRGFAQQPSLAAARPDEFVCPHCFDEGAGPQAAQSGMVMAYSGKNLREYAAAEVEALTAENARLRTVMVAAAEEIQAHWDAHCDAEGYGPANLMRRLEEGIPSQYGYTAGRFAELEAERDRLREELTARRMLPSERLHNICEAIQAESDGSAFSREEWNRLDAENNTLRSELGSLISKFHHAMKDAGWHPGRTDDSLCDIIREKGKQMVALELEAARYRWIRRKDISMSEHDELMDAVKYRVEDDFDAAIDAMRKPGC